MNTLYLYQLFGDWADDLIFCFIALSVQIIAYLFTVFYRWQKNKKHIWNPELPVLIFTFSVALGVLLGKNLSERYEDNLSILLKKETVQQVDSKTTIDPGPPVDEKISERFLRQ